MCLKKVSSVFLENFKQSFKSFQEFFNGVFAISLLHGSSQLPEQKEGLFNFEVFLAKGMAASKFL